MLGLCCCAGSLVAVNRGCSLVEGRRHLTAVASPVDEQALSGAPASVIAAPGLESMSSGAVVHGLSCSAARGIFPDQGSNLCLLHWQADSLPLSHQGSPVFIFS